VLLWPSNRRPLPPCLDQLVKDCGGFLLVLILYSTASYSRINTYRPESRDLPRQLPTTNISHLSTPYAFGGRDNQRHEQAPLVTSTFASKLRCKEFSFWSLLNPDSTGSTLSTSELYCRRIIHRSLLCRSSARWLFYCAESQFSVAYLTSDTGFLDRRRMSRWTAIPILPT